MGFMIDVILRLLGVKSNLLPEQTRKLCTELFGMAESKIQIVSGNLAKDFYTDGSIGGALAKSKASVEIVYGPGADEESKRVLSGLRPNGRVKLYEHPTPIQGHFMIVDGKHARVEAGHHPKQEERRAFIKYNTFFLSGRLAEEFNRLKAESRPNESSF